MFLDRVHIIVKGGDGGSGIISFRREAHVPRGGPDGGDGGRGGSVTLRVDTGMTTLSDFRYRKTLAATSGGDGGAKNKSGKAGSDLMLRVPQGTIIVDRATGERIADLVAPDEELVIAKGGHGGRGNARFVSSTRRIPRIAEDGQPGEARELDLELKLIADVGLVGLPNAGKSSLLAALTRAHPKIADYPFTTITPNLGVARLDEREMVIADIPGLIEGASTGAGLGEEFLRHIERTRVLALLCDASSPDPDADVALVERELKEYSAILAEKPRVRVLTKADVLSPEDRLALHEKARQAGEFMISAHSGEGVAELLDALWRRLAEMPGAEVTDDDA